MLLDSAGRDPVHVHMNTPWVVRRIRSTDGRDLPRPHLWGRVFASSASVAVQKFINMTGGTENPKHFDAIPAPGA